MPRVFISYASEDREFVRREIVALLNRLGVATWFATEDIRSATDWEGSIREGLESCDWFLVAMSPNSLASQWVQAETHWALDERPGHVVPVLIENCDLSKWHLKLRRIQHVDFRHDLSRRRPKLLEVWGKKADADACAAEL